MHLTKVLLEERARTHLGFIAHEVGHSLDLGANWDTLSSLLSFNELEEIYKLYYQHVITATQRFINSNLITNYKAFSKSEDGTTNRISIEDLEDALNWESIQLVWNSNYNSNTMTDEFFSKYLKIPMEQKVQAPTVDIFDQEPFISEIFRRYPEEIKRAWEANVHTGNSAKNVCNLVSFFSLKMLAENYNGEIPSEIIKSALKVVSRSAEEYLAETASKYLAVSLPLVRDNIENASQVQAEMEIWPQVKYLKAMARALGDARIIQSLQERTNKEDLEDAKRITSLLSKT